ncbi:hypothetical protein E3N88_41246 [Mikania micrantha]|uniref:Uncharacterized protein n=1 Tax=Mikania micrantha TaxID=192012 RepID=A0A5N6LQ02_9ASTR|nr:hypothetical protein E3N88_41246 [Mikania micrantha]
MYYSIVNNVRPPVPAGARFPKSTRAFEILKNMPKDEIVKAYEQTILILKTFTQTKLIIPSASNLHAAGFRFHSLPEHYGIKETIFMRKEVSLPVITLNKTLENVIKGDLPADEVVKLFKGMSGSIPDMKTTEKTKLQKTIDKINMAYNSRLSMMPYFFLKRLAHWLLVALKAIDGFVESSWKIVAFILSLVSVLMLTAQAYCEVFGCGNTKR